MKTLIALILFVCLYTDAALARDGFVFNLGLFPSKTEENKDSDSGASSLKMQNLEANLGAGFEFPSASYLGLKLLYWNNEGTFTNRGMGGGKVDGKEL